MPFANLHGNMSNSDHRVHTHWRASKPSMVCRHRYGPSRRSSRQCRRSTRIHSPRKPRQPKAVHRFIPRKVNPTDVVVFFFTPGWHHESTMPARAGKPCDVVYVLTCLEDPADLHTHETGWNLTKLARTLLLKS